MTAQNGLYAKLAEVTAELGYVAKDGKNDFQNYRYTSAEALLAAIRGPLSSRGVVLMPSLTALSEREYVTSKGKASIITTAHVKFTFVDGESGQTHECEWAGEGDDPADKGLGKAYTNAIKTFARAQFLIPQGDDPEADKSTDERAADRAPSRRPVNGSQARSQPPSDAPTKQDVEALKSAAKGLTGAQIKLALTACGVDTPEPFNAAAALATIPKPKVVLVAEALSEMERS